MSFYRSSALRCWAEKLISDTVQLPRRARGPPLCCRKRWRTPQWYAGAGGVSLEEVEEIDVEGEIEVEEEIVEIEEEKDVEIEQIELKIEV